MTNRTELVLVTAIIVTNFAGCTNPDRKAAPTPPVIPDDVLVARLALMEHIHRFENLRTLNGLPRIIFVGRYKSDHDPFEFEDLPDDVFGSLHSTKFTIKPVSKVKFDPTAVIGPMSDITDADTGDRGIRILIDEMQFDQRSATVVTRSVMCSLDGYGPTLRVSLSCKEGKWTVINSMRTIVP